MNEQLLQFIWKHGYFNRNELHSVNGEELEIINSGEWNHDQGPDFLTARIKCGETEWVGNVEIHIKTTDWLRHGHHSDPQYNNVILHVVWEHNGSEVSGIPVLELRGRISGLLLDRYTGWMNNMNSIPCELEWTYTHLNPDENWRNTLMNARLERKSVRIREFLEKNNCHWEEVFWWMIARNFGHKVNADAFEAMARSLPLNIITRHKNQIHQLEALLFGQCNLLIGNFQDAYMQLLQREYRFLSTKYQLKPIFFPVKFLRMRPGNFPTIRLAQLARLIQESIHLFAFIKDTDNLKDVYSKFNVGANDYWHYHYRPDEPSPFREKMLGRPMIENIIINTVVPVLFAYGSGLKEEKYLEKALRWLMQVPAEQNSFTFLFEKLGFHIESARDSQAALQLKKYYCDEKRCLDCAVGKILLRKSVQDTILLD